MVFRFKSFFTVFFTGLIMSVGSAYANISTVGYVHDAILNKTGVNLSLESGINRNQPHSVKYMMRQIDRANLTLGFTTTNVTGASTNITDKAKVYTEVNLRAKEPGFKVTLSNTNSMSFEISASGTFGVNWGDGNVETITKANTVKTTYSHTYASRGNYVFTISGVATGYNTSDTVAAISFENSNGRNNITKLEGSIGAVFPTISGTYSPRFYQTFFGCSNLTSIPYGLFDGIHTNPIKNMFYRTFNSTGITSIPDDLFSGIEGVPAVGMFEGAFTATKITSIPEYLFSAIYGAPAERMFADTFSWSNVSSIPEYLFSGISGAPAAYMFDGTFSYCSALEGGIPSGLFSGINGAPAPYMFHNTFLNCEYLTSIPSDLFGNISGLPQEYMFGSTFSGCASLTSIPAGLFSGISYGYAPYMFSYTFSDCYGLTSSIPSSLFGNLEGAPAKFMFAGTFYGCENLSGSIPSGLFGNINGAPAYAMFQQTFQSCTGLSGYVPSGLFGTLYGEAATSMFERTFAQCIGLDGIDYGIWDISGINTNSEIMLSFNEMFDNCYSIWSDSPTISQHSSVKLWEHFTYHTSQAFVGCTNMWDYDDMPSGWN